MSLIKKRQTTPKTTAERVRKNEQKKLQEGHYRLSGWLSPVETQELREVIERYEFDSVIDTIRYLIKTEAHRVRNEKSKPGFQKKVNTLCTRA